MKFRNTAGAWKLLLVTSLLVGGAAHAGGLSDGGGKGVLCNDRLSTLDLFEARQRGLPILRGEGNFEEDLVRFGTEVFKHFNRENLGKNGKPAGEMVREVLHKTVISRFRAIPAGERLPSTSDATLPQLPSGCSVVQIATYRGDGTILLDVEYWRKLDSVERAALVVHEYIYHRARTSGSTTSDETRLVLGLIFSGKNPVPLFKPVWTAERVAWCLAGSSGTAAENFEFYVTDETDQGKNGIGIYFRRFKNVYVTAATWAFVPGVQIKDLIARTYPLRFATAKNLLSDEEWVFELGTDTSTESITVRAHQVGESTPPPSLGSCRLER